MSVSLGKRSHWYFHESKFVSFVGAQSGNLPVLRHSFVERKWLYNNVCSRWTYNDPLRAKYNAKMAGMNAPIAKPKGSKKLKDWESR
ncbi:hypothetical protein CsSME_00043959 [Camellia sinensis var. sinensis]